MSTPTNHSFVLCAPTATHALAARIAARLGKDLLPIEEREFGGGESKVRPLASVRGQHTYIIQSLNGDTVASANDKFCRLLFLAGALHDAGAAAITVCLPYMAFARKDRRTKFQDPVNSRYVAQLIETMGVLRVIALDVHNVAAFENSLRCESVSITALKIFAKHFATDSRQKKFAVVSPDVGGIKRARFFQEAFEQLGQADVAAAFMDKKRSAGVVTGETLVGEVRDREVIVIDDLISSGETIQRTVVACRTAGAARIHAVATHAVFSTDARQLFSTRGPDSVVVSDSVALGEEFKVHLGRKLHVVEVAPLLAEAIIALERGSALENLTLF